MRPPGLYVVLLPVECVWFSGTFQQRSSRLPYLLHLSQLHFMQNIRIFSMCYQEVDPSSSFSFLSCNYVRNLYILYPFLFSYFFVPFSPIFTLATVYLFPILCFRSAALFSKSPSWYFSAVYFASTQTAWPYLRVYTESQMGTSQQMLNPLKPETRHYHHHHFSDEAYFLFRLQRPISYMVDADLFFFLTEDHIKNI